MSINDLQREKERLIIRYMQLQDVIDNYNNEIYKLCCQIEALNILIEGEKKKSGVNGTAAETTHGKAHGGNGNGHGHVAPEQQTLDRPNRHPEAE
jgi:hypothetical protein